MAAVEEAGNAAEAMEAARTAASLPTRRVTGRFTSWDARRARTAPSRQGGKCHYFSLDFNGVYPDIFINALILGESRVVFITYPSFVISFFFFLFLFLFSSFSLLHFI